jgi:tripartite ATP-independent transporter DctM subunit
MGFALMVMIYITAKRRNYQRHKRESLRQIFKSFLSAAPALFAPVIIVGGILGGIFSPTEAAMVAVIYAIILNLLATKSFRIKDYMAVLADAVEGTAVIMLILTAAVVFGTLLAHENVPVYIMKVLAPFSHSRWLSLLAMNILLLIVGCILEPIISLLIFLPMLLPAAIKIGIDPVHFGMISVLNLMIGLITPPVGMVLYVITNIAQVPFERVARATMTFIIPLLIVLALITYIPDIVMFLPNLFLGSR